jgi:hypothetical protein
MKENEISEVTRRNIADEVIVSNIKYSGGLDEAKFLSRIYKLKELPSFDYRSYRYRNAYEDIYHHTVRYPRDWSPDWVYNDSRINLSHCADASYLIFLAETLHPMVRSDKDEIDRLLEIYNRHLAADGFEIIAEGAVSGHPTYAGRKKFLGASHSVSKTEEIKKLFSTEYVDQQIDTMASALKKGETNLAIGTAKELLETTCKSILEKQGIAIDSKWDFLHLAKETHKHLDFIPVGIDSPEKARRSIDQLLGGILSTVHGVVELRNAYGTGHGKEADFKGLDVKCAKLLVDVVTAMVIFYLTTKDGSDTEASDDLIFDTAII